MENTMTTAPATKTATVKLKPAQRGKKETMATAKESLAKALQATKVIEHFMGQTLPSAFPPYVYAAAKFERYDGDTDTATITVTVDIEAVAGFLKEFAPHLLTAIEVGAQPVMNETRQG